VSLSACGLRRENKVCRGGAGARAIGVFAEKIEVSPSPPPITEIITLARNSGSGLVSAQHRNSRQNPDDKELKGQNPHNKGLKRRRLALELTVTASTMIADLIWGGKVRCHIGAVEK
jgi:hypothetical protein